jgi:6-phosphogluconolactonase (cycloisomerase 2 family)
MCSLAVAAGTDPRSVCVDPSGKFVYVANASSNDISVYTINAVSGALTNAGTVAGTGSGAYSVTVERSGKFAYVSNSDSNNVSAYSINATTGALTSIGVLPAGNGPVSITTTGTMQ